MKLIIASILLLLSFAGYSQTVIPATTTVETLNSFSKGAYRFFTTVNKDTVELTTDTLICPACPVCPVCPPPVVCPPPIVCPVCPVCPPQRYSVGFTVNKAGQVITTYNDGSTSIFTLTKPIVIQ